MAAFGTTQVLLYVRCRDLKDKDVTSKSDPYAVIYEKDTAGRLREIGRTETMKDALNPEWSRGIPATYVFEVKQEFVVKIMDDDGTGDACDEALGTATFQMARVVASRNSTAEFDLQNEWRRGKVTITAKEQSKAGQDTVALQFEGSALKKMDTFGQSDPYFKLIRRLPNGAPQLLFQSSVQKKTLNPAWEALPVLRVADLTTADMSEDTLRFECYDEDLTSDDTMGAFNFSFQQLMHHFSTKQPFELVSESGERFGAIYVKRCAITHFPTFFELLNGGMSVSLAVAIDFTGSNGDPRDSRSLHYMDPHRPNQYVQALMSVGDILLPYDTDKQVPAFGFGAKLPDGQVSHFFHLNFQPNPFVPGVQGVLDAYGNALRSVALAGPTNFAPTIAAVRDVAAGAANSYTILLILTDGSITDLQHTIDAIVSCDRAPMSIIIVGVGNCEFEDMDKLDGDKTRLQGSSGPPMKRDIVQFVPFRKFAHAPPGALAAEVLREVPRQVEEMYRLNPPAR